MPGYHKLHLPERYRALLDLDASGFAWEWLRRNPEFRALWAEAGEDSRHASARALVAGRRVTHAVTRLRAHPLEKRTAPWGLTFSPAPETPATAHPLLGWTPELRGDTISLVRPLPWARPLDSLRFEPSHWGPGVFQLETADGAHLLIRCHGTAELPLWLPAGLAPRPRGSFGLYLHADHHLVHRARAAARLRRAVGIGQPLRPRRRRQAHRLAAMLYIHDRISAGLSLRDIAAELLAPMPDDWRSSSERSDLRRLADAAAAMVAGGYRTLLAPRGNPQG